MEGDSGLLDLLKIFGASSDGQGSSSEDDGEEEEEEEDDESEDDTEALEFLIRARSRKCKTCGQPIEMDMPSRRCNKCDCDYCMGCLHQVCFRACCVICSV
jgi:hypothetical protein